MKKHSEPLICVYCGSYVRQRLLFTAGNSFVTSTLKTRDNQLEIALNVNSTTRLFLPPSTCNIGNIL